MAGGGQCGVVGQDSPGGVVMYRLLVDVLGLLVRRRGDAARWKPTASTQVSGPADPALVRQAIANAGYRVDPDHLRQHDRQGEPMDTPISVTYPNFGHHTFVG